MTLYDVMLIIGVFFIGWLFWRQLAVREFALRHALQLCDEQGLQLLDQSIGLAKLKFTKLKAGGVGLLREYRFEFTSTGERRYNGRVFMVGQTLQRYELDAFREPNEFH